MHISNYPITLQPTNITRYFSEMSSFPPRQWQVRYLKDLETMQGTVREDKPISLEALLAIQPSEGEEGTFRFTLAGPQHLQMRIRVTDILQEKAFDNMWLSFQMELGTQVAQK